MIKIASLYGLTALIFLAIDAVWLSKMTTAFYRPEMGALLRARPDFAVAIAFYLLYVVGIVVFAGLPALEAGSPMRALLAGALFGLVAYATYDLTNLATINGFPWRVAVVDMVWGACVTGVSACAAVWLMLKLGGHPAT